MLLEKWNGLSEISKHVLITYKTSNMEPRKLSLHHAAKIREYYDQDATQNWLATKFGVSKGTIKLIVQRKTYKEA